MSVLRGLRGRYRTRVAPRVDRARQSLEALTERHANPASYAIEGSTAQRATVVESYWTGHTVNSVPFLSAAASLRYLAERQRDYRPFHELMGLWGDHSSDVVLDFGCGPGNDLVGFLTHGKARQVIGIDVSLTALELARHRIALHDIDPRRVRLIKTSDAEPAIPLPDASVDYVYCQGVLHHVTDPTGVIRELRRVLRPGGDAAVMVYNFESVWCHLAIAYRRQILEGTDAAVATEEAFRRSADEGAPIATAYHPAEFVAHCEDAGLEVTFGGGYFSPGELELFDELGPSAIADERLGRDHRTFLAGLSRDEHGFLLHEGLAAGLGGSYRVTAKR